MKQSIKTLGSIVIIINVTAFAVHAFFGNFYQITKSSQTSTTSSKDIVMETNKEMKENHLSDSIVYGDWNVSKIGDIILYSSHGSIVHGHKFGWIKKVGQCNYDNLYLTYSSVHEDKDILEQLKNNKVPLKLVFPESGSSPIKMHPPIISVNDFGSMKIITLSNIQQNNELNAYLEELHSVEIAITSPYAKLFDIPKDSWSLDGYIASKLKAKELCDAETAKKNTVIAFNH